MTDPLAEMTPDDLAGFWRPLSDAETTVATNLIEVLSSIIRGRLPLIDSWITDGAVDPVVVRWVMSSIIQPIIQGISRPAGARSESRTMGSTSYTVSYDTAAAATQATQALPSFMSYLIPPSLLNEMKPASVIYQPMPVAGNALRGWYGDPIPPSLPDGNGPARRPGRAGISA